MEPTVFYWDANPFLDFFNGEEHVDICTQILKAGERNEVRIITSSISLVEVIHIKHRTRMTPDKENILREYFERDYIKIIDADRTVCEYARELVWRNQKLEYKDSIHISSAIIANRIGKYGKIEAFHSFDKVLCDLNNKIGSPPLHICHPYLHQPVFTAKGF